MSSEKNSGHFVSKSIVFQICKRIFVLGISDEATSMIRLSILRVGIIASLILGSLTDMKSMVSFTQQNKKSKVKISLRTLRIRLVMYCKRIGKT